MAQARSEVAGSVVPVTKQQAVVMLESAYLSMDLGKFDEARAIITGAAALMPKTFQPQVALGTLEFNQGRYEKALQAFRAAQRLAPKAALPRAHCGEVLMFMGKLNEAMKELKAAIGLEPRSDGAKFAQSLIDAKEAGAFPLPKAKK